MASSRLKRVALGSLIPPILGGLVFYVFLCFHAIFISTRSTFFTMESEGLLLNIIELIWSPIYMVILSVIFFGIPSVLYSLIMELVIQKINNNILVIFISMLLGALVASILGSNTGIIGGVIGLIVGYYLRRLKLEPANKSLKQDK